MSIILKAGLVFFSMINQYEIDNLNSDESDLLHYIISRENTEPANTEYINCARKEYLIYYYMRNKQKFNESGHKIYRSLMEKLTPGFKNVEI